MGRTSSRCMVLLCCLLHAVTALPISEQGAEDAWKGLGRTRMGPCSRQQWELHGGFCTDQERLAEQEKYAQLRRQVSQTFGTDGDEVEMKDEIDALRLDDFRFTRSQADEFMMSLRAHAQDRRKRKIRSDFTVNKWNSTIYYTIDGSVGGEGNKNEVRAGIALWAASTCLQFVEIAEEEVPPAEQWMVFGMFGAHFGCSSFIGRSSEHVPQPIYLNDACLEKTVVAHEIAHALGVIHEHQRNDRDQFINVIHENLYMSSSALFTTYRSDLVTTLDTPYDYASVMHYYGQAFTKNDKDTITTKDRRYQMTIGQRVELSFLDSTLINHAYCPEICVDSTTQCEHQGYPHPHDCSRCLCPDGWAGRYCEQLRGPQLVECGGELVAGSTPQTISSPGNSIGSSYERGQECTWRITAGSGQHIVLEFTGSFHIHSYNDACFDWVEVKMESDKYHIPGPRYCGRERPEGTINTGSHDVLILFRAKSKRSYKSERTGFSLQFSAVNANACSSSPCEENERCTMTSSGYACHCERDCDVDVCENADRYAHIGNGMNLVVALDTSRRTSKTTDNIIDFITQCLCSVQRGSRSSHQFAAMVYTLEARYFSNFYSYISTLHSSMHNNYFSTYGDADFFAAIESNVNHYFSDSVNERNLLIVHTDSPFRESDTLSQEIDNASALLRDKHVELITIAIGLSSRDIRYHKKIAGDWNVFQLSHYSVFSQPSQLDSKVRTIVSRISQISHRQLQTVDITSSTQTISTTARYTTTIPTSTLVATETTTPPTTTQKQTTQLPQTQSTQKSTVRSTSLPTTLTSTTSTPSTSKSTTIRPSTATSTPTTTTFSPTTTTTTTTAPTTRRRPTTTTTTATTPRTTSWYQSSPEKCVEQPLACAQCGGCGYRIVETWCSDPQGHTYLSSTREEECREACVINCSIWIGRLYRRSCKVCCNQAVKINDECILIENLSGR